jgi:ubiquinone/menaquinone biosynthesis C-methylase UbiE
MQGGRLQRKQHTGGKLMAGPLIYSEQAAAGYDRTFGHHVSTRLVPALIRAADLGAGMHVLDVATGTGLAALAALEIVGLTGTVKATDISPGMLARAKKRLVGYPNVSFSVEDGQSLSLPTGAFDRVLCALGLMFFPDPAQGAAEFYRVLRAGGRAAVSVGTKVAYDAEMTRALARHAPDLTPAAERMFSLESEDRLRSLFIQAGFQEVEVVTDTQIIQRSSFEEYIRPYEQGGGTLGEAFARLPPEVRDVVREEVRRGLGDTGGPIEIPSEIRIASGRKPT